MHGFSGCPVGDQDQGPRDRGISSLTCPHCGTTTVYQRTCGGNLAQFLGGLDLKDVFSLSLIAVRAIGAAARGTKVQPRHQPYGPNRL